MACLATVRRTSACQTTSGEVGRSTIIVWRRRGTTLVLLCWGHKAGDLRLAWRGRTDLRHVEEAFANGERRDARKKFSFGATGDRCGQFGVYQTFAASTIGAASRCCCVVVSSVSDPLDGKDTTAWLRAVASCFRGDRRRIAKRRHVASSGEPNC